MVRWEGTGALPCCASACWMAAAPQSVPCWASVWRRATTTWAMRWGVGVGVVLGRLLSAALQEGSGARERSRPVESQLFEQAHSRQRSSMGAPARYLSMARGRRCACIGAMGDSLGACCSTCEIALCSRCPGTSISVVAACRGAGAWSAPAGNGVRATDVGRHAAGGGAPGRQRLPLWPSGLTPRAPCGCGPSPGVATCVPWHSA